MSIGDPGKYHGGKICPVKLKNGVNCWAFSSTQYVHDAVNNVKQYLKSKNDKLVAKAPAPFKSDYCLDIDMMQRTTTL